MSYEDQFEDFREAAATNPAILIALTGIKAQFDYAEIRYMVSDLQNFLSPRVDTEGSAPKWMPENLKTFLSTRGGDYVDHKD